MKQAELVKKLSSASPEKSEKLVKQLLEHGSEYNVYPLSPEQQRLYFLQNYTDYGKYSYICPYEFETSSYEDSEKILNAIHELVKAHEILRTLYFSVNGTAFQTVCSPDDIEISCMEYDLSEEYAASKDIYANRLNEIFTVPFELDKELSVKCCRIKKSEELYSVIMIMHHINHDAWTIGMLIKEVELYLKSGIVGSEKYSYIDYVKWRNSEECLAKEQEDLLYWKETLDENNGDIGMKIISGKREKKSCVAEGTVDSSIDEKIEKIIAGTSITVSNFYLAALNLALCSFSLRDDVNIGTIVLNRDNADFLSTYGFFANTIVVYTHIDRDMKFVDFLKKVSDDALGALKRSNVSFDKIVDAVCSERNGVSTPLFQTMFSFYGRNLLGGANSEDLSFRFSNLTPANEAQQDLFVSVDEYLGSTRIGVMTDSAKITDEWTKRFYELLIDMITKAASEPEKKISEIIDINIGKEFRDFTEANKADNDEEIEASGIRDDINIKIKSIVEAKLDINDPDENESLFRLGGNSMNSIYMLEAINSEFGVDIEISELFRYSTIALLADLIREKKGISSSDDEIEIEEF